MKRRIGIVFVCLTLMLSTVGFSVAVTNDTIYVDDDGTADYTSIQDAVDAASDGDTIYVFSGTYNEHIVINDKSIMLEGEDKETTILDAGGSGSAIILKNADDCTITGFTFQNISGLVWFEAGIVIDSSKGCVVTDTMIYNCGHAIFIYKSSDIQITFNNIYENIEGIVFYDTDDVTVERNNFENCSAVGMYFNKCRTVSIVENNFIDNKRHLTLFGILDVNIDANYWERIIQLNIKPFLWIPLTIIPLPFLTFDWHPADEPYDF